MILRCDIWGAAFLPLLFCALFNTEDAVQSPSPAHKIHKLANNLKRGTYHLWTLGGHGGVRGENRDADGGESATPRRYAHIPASRQEDEAGGAR